MNPSKGSAALFARLTRYVMPYWPPFMLTLLLVLVEVGFDIAIAMVQKILIDQIHLSNAKELAQFVRISVIVSIAVILLIYVQYYLRGYFQQMMNRDLSLQLFDTINRLPFSKAAAFHSGDLSNRITDDAGKASGVTGQVMFGIVSNVALCAVAFFFLVIIDFWLAVIALASAPIPFIAGRLFDTKLRALSGEVQARGAQVRGLLQEGAQGMPTVKAFGMEHALVSKFENQRKEQNGFILKRTTLTSWMGQSISLTNNAVMIAAGFFISAAAIKGTLSIGSVLAFLFLMERIQGPFANVSQLVGTVQQGLNSADRVFAILDMAEEQRPSRQYNVESQESAEMANNDGYAIRLRNVTYSVEANNGERQVILDSIDLEVKPGELVAIVGPSGSGKSTLARLCCGLLEPDSGQVDRNGEVAYVPQNAQLFSGTIEDNIACGSPEPLQESIVDAANQAYAREFIERLDDKYSTYIGEQGLSLSGGQRQRIALARAIMKKAPVWVLDEPTSALDEESERAVQQTLERLLRGQSGLMITHRLSAARAASRIVVLEQGQLTEQGTFDELMERNGSFARLFQLTERGMIDAG